MCICVVICCGGFEIEVFFDVFEESGVRMDVEWYEVSVGGMVV